MWFYYGMVAPYCVVVIVYHWLKKWLHPYWTLRHYLNWWLLIDSWTPGINIKFRFQNKTIANYSTKSFWKCRLQNIGHFVHVSMCKMTCDKLGCVWQFHFSIQAYTVQTTPYKISLTYHFHNLRSIFNVVTYHNCGMWNYSVTIRLQYLRVVERIDGKFLMWRALEWNLNMFHMSGKRP